MNTQLAPNPKAPTQALTASLSTVPVCLKRFYDACPECAGEGSVETIHYHGIGDGFWQHETQAECPQCGGDGEVEVCCPQCGGAGLVVDDEGIEGSCMACLPPAIAAAPSVEIVAAVGHEVPWEDVGLVWDIFDITIEVNPQADITSQIKAHLANELPGESLQQWGIPLLIKTDEAEF